MTAESYRPTVGDWVRVKDGGHVAMVRTVESDRYGNPGACKLEPPAPHFKWWFDASELEPAQPPKEGSRAVMYGAIMYEMRSTRAFNYDITASGDQLPGANAERPGKQ